MSDNLTPMQLKCLQAAAEPDRERNGMVTVYAPDLRAFLAERTELVALMRRAVTDHDASCEFEVGQDIIDEMRKFLPPPPEPTT